MVSSPSADDLRAAFTFTRFDPIQGEPSYESLYKLETQATRNAATVAVRLPPPHINLSGIVEQPAVYVLRVGAPFPRPIYPGDTPTFPAGTTVADRQTLTSAHAANMRSYLTCQTTENILKTMLENAIEHSYLAGIHSATLGFGARTLQDIFLHLYQTYGRISPASLQANTTKLTTPIAAHLPIALIFRQIEDCQRFALAGQTPLTNEQIIRAAESLILATGKYQLAYREWIGLPAPQKTFNNFRIRFSNEYLIQNEMQASTAQSQGFVGQVAEEPDLSEAVANFAQASAADRSAFTQLTDTNAYLQRNLAQVSASNDELYTQIADLQNQVNMMNLVQNPSPPAYQPAQQPTRPQPPRYTAPQQPAPYNAPYQPPHQQPYNHMAGHQGRGRGRNNGRNEQFGMPNPYGNLNPTNPYLLNAQNHQYGRAPGRANRNQRPYWAQGAQATQGRAEFQNPPSLVKRFANWNYCFSHGFDVKDDHESCNCRNPAWNHNWTATRDNTMGGSQRGRSKIHLPSVNQGMNH